MKKIEDIVKLSVGKTKEIGARYRQVISIGDFETKTFETFITVELDCESGVERNLALTILEAQMEYNCACKMFVDGNLSSEKLAETTQRIETCINAMIKQAEIAGVDVSNLLDIATDYGADTTVSKLITGQEEHKEQKEQKKSKESKETKESKKPKEPKEPTQSTLN